MGTAALPSSSLSIEPVNLFGVDSHNSVVRLAALESEGSLQAVSMEDQQRREQLVKQIRMLPRDALQTMRHFQTQVGCLNRCSFCSQSAGTTLWNMSQKDLANLVAALKTVGLEWAREDNAVCAEPLSTTGVFSRNFVMPIHGLIGNKRKDRPGVIYCYLDNDPAAYPHLDDMVRWLHDDLGVKIRIATVGYSRHNSAIQAMHERISNTLMTGIAGLRLSFSPYTYGWTRAAERVGVATRDDFERDSANLLNTYRNTFLSAQRGRKGTCVELRFRPLVVANEVNKYEVDGHLVIRSGLYLVIQKAANRKLPTSTITDAKSHSTELSHQGEPCWLIYGVNHEDDSLITSLLRGDILPVGLKCKDSLLHQLQNEDGEYFAVDATRQSNGITAKYFYPKTAKRPGSGFIDGERYLLNLLIQAKTTGKNQTWGDVEGVMNALHQQAVSLDVQDPMTATYIREQVIELVKSYVRVLHLAEFPASAFFDKNISVETGHICNLGRAFHEYKSIASRPDLPLTPHHERAFGLTGELAEEGQAWRLAVSPVHGTSLSMSARGGRNIYRESPSILMERLDLTMTATPEGQSIERYFLDIENVERITIRDAKNFPVIPGHLKGE